MMKADAIAAECVAESTSPGVVPARRPRFIVIERGGYVFGDTACCDRFLFSRPPRRLTPQKAVRLIESMICDQPVHRYREVAREDAAATFDVYLAAPDYEIDWRAADAAAVARDCEYVATLARIYPRCCFCRKLTEYHLWQYGQDAAPVREKGRCCDRCYVRRVLPVRLKAEGYSQEEIDEHVRNERAYLGVIF